MQIEAQNMNKYHAEMLSDMDKGLRLHRRSDGVQLTIEQQSANRYERLKQEEKYNKNIRLGNKVADPEQEEEFQKVNEEGTQEVNDSQLQLSQQGEKTIKRKRKAVQRLASDDGQTIKSSKKNRSSQGAIHEKQTIEAPTKEYISVGHRNNSDRKVMQFVTVFVILRDL